MIPKKIHYCWFGGNPKPDSVMKCINSWKKFCPDYEIIEWNESNFDIHCMPFVEQAIEAKKYAFASDVARLIVVYENGGLYFDTDVEVVRNFDDLLDNKAFLGFENTEYVASGLGFGSEAGVEFFKEHIDAYKDEVFIKDDGTFNMLGCPRVATKLLVEKGLIANGCEQVVDGVHIYPADYFNPYDSITGRLTKTNHTYSIHWYDASWDNKSQSRLKFNRFMRRMLGVNTIEKIKKILGR
ncbi:MAG: glycosyl transferase [Clostridium sp.]|nr:glycosyl transferase [Clostridium sp.]